MTTTHQVRIAVLWLSIIVSSLVSCSKREIELDEADPTMIKAITEKLIEASATSKSEKEVLWNPGDEIAVFSGELSGKFESTLKKKPSSAAVFRGDLGLEAWPEELDIWAVYPYSEEASFDGETITTVLPSEQIARDGEFGKDMNLAIAHSNTSTLQFYNVGGGIRFSVTEEGIKKVMFEGLGGEIISGKVEIGFDEDGLPEIRKVVKGSQFITILPPDGQETFQKDTWYYIVVIPGSLERGYKLRFYKDSDYARKVSNNAIKIKRSFYRDMVNADDGIEYEPQVTHFPETEDEWLDAEQRLYMVGKQVQTVLDIASENNKDMILEQIKSIDGVLNVFLAEDGTASVLQKDSLWVYFFPENARLELKAFDEENDEGSINEVVSKTKKKSGYLNRNNTKENVNADNQALILAPYFGSASNKIKEYLMNCGFQENNIHIKKDTSANILLFKGSNLQQYKYVFIDTHGGTGYYTDETLKTGVNNQTIFMSATKFTARRARNYVATKQLTKDQIAIRYHDEGDLRFCMNAAFISSTDFSSTTPFFFLGACHSAEIENKLDGGSMVGTLLTNHAGAIAGYSNSVSSGVNSRYAKYVLLFMSNGFSFQRASKYWKENETFEEYCASYRYYVSNPSIWEEDDKEVLSKLSAEEREGRHIDKDLYQYYPKNPVQEYFLVNPVPELINPSIAIVGQPVLLEWESDLKPFDLDFSFTQYKDGQGTPFNKVFTYKVKYEVYIDGNKLGKTLYTDDTDKKASWKPSSIGKHTWHIVGKIVEGDTVLASYQSGEGSFIVTGETIPVNSISLEQSNLELTVGSSTMLKATILPDNATNKSVSWSSSNPSVATVSSTGEVKGIAKGNAIITVKTEDGGKTATCNVTVKESSAFDVVDLGLSVNWASSNIGATKPEESGTYYAWGETSGKTNFSWENYKWLDPSSYTLTKYCGDPEYGYNGYVDSKTKLDNADDVARTILGDGWRMPTRAEFEELFNPKNCTVVWEELNGVNVVKLTSLKNGKVLYLPAVGIYDEDTLYYSGTYGAYWTSTFSPDDPTNAFFFTFDSSTHNTDTGYRYRGCPVRAVKAK